MRHVQDIDAKFGVVSHAIKKSEPKTLPHMQAVINETFEKPVQHFMLSRTIDFKRWLDPFSDHTLSNLADSHEIRIAMAPYAGLQDATLLPSGPDRPLPVLQSKPVAGDEFDYFPVLGVRPLKARPQYIMSTTSGPNHEHGGSVATSDNVAGATTSHPQSNAHSHAVPQQSTSGLDPASVLMLCEVRPLFCGCQPKKRVYVFEDDGTTPAYEADGVTPKTRLVDIPSTEMDCTDNLSSLEKLMTIIKVLHDKHAMYNTLEKYPEHTTEAMMSWWEEFHKYQKDIMLLPSLRGPVPLNSTTDPDLFAAFDNLILQHQLDEGARHTWLTQQCPAARMRHRQELVRTCEYSSVSLNQNFTCPTTSTMEVAEYKDLQALLAGVLPETPMARRHKPFLVLSCGTDPKAIDLFAGYFGKGPSTKAKKSPLLWAWVCEVQEVLEHSDDWTSATIKVHWYRPAHKSKKQWACAFWTKGSTPESHTIVWDVDEPEDPSYWYMEEYSITIGQVIGQFDSFLERNVNEKDADQNVVVDENGKAKKVKGLFLHPYIQTHCENRCQELNGMNARQSQASGLVTIPTVTARPTISATPTMISDSVPGAGAHVHDPELGPDVATARVSEDTQGLACRSVSPTTALAEIARNMISSSNMEVHHKATINTSSSGGSSSQNGMATAAKPSRAHLTTKRARPSVVAGKYPVHAHQVPQARLVNNKDQDGGRSRKRKATGLAYEAGGMSSSRQRVGRR